MTYDSRIHLYNLSPALSRPHMMIITDCEELELPVVEGLLVPLKDCRHILERFWNGICSTNIIIIKTRGKLVNNIVNSKVNKYS